MVNRLKMRVLGGLLVCLLCGCGAKESGPPSVEKITTFSLGSARAPVFDGRPTAEELCDAVERLYDSFHSVAVSYTSTLRTVNDWRRVPGEEAYVFEPRVYEMTLEYRAKEPDKELLTVSTEEYHHVNVINGKRSYLYDATDNTYVSPWASDQDVRSPDLKHSPGLLILAVDDNTPVRRRLLPDATVRGERVYVLQLRIEPKSRDSAERRGASSVHTLYLGKSDLLPRKIEIVWEDKTAEQRKGGLPNNRATHIYSGLIANLDLPDELFDPTPPAGAKRGEPPQKAP